jgi:hypothetical protein
LGARNSHGKKVAPVAVETMRVIVTNDSGQSSPVAVPERLDLREEPGAIERIDAARQHPALRGLLLNLNAEESPFSTVGCKVWAATEGAEPSVFASRIDLIVWQGAAGLGQAQYDDLATRLAGLLEREPGDALRVELQIAPAQFSGGRQGFCLRLLLFAGGAAQEQARLRWTLGLVRVQQALLFLARAIRQNRVSIE